MGRKQTVVNEKQLIALAKIQCTLPEIAAVLGCSARTLQRNHKEAILNGRKQGRTSVRRAQYKLLENGNATMAIWLGKQLLGQTDKTTHDGHLVKHETNVTVVTDLERCSRYFDEFAKRQLGSGTVPPDRN